MKLPATIAAGLCANCRHARSTTSDRGAVYVLCALWKNGGFAKYPRLPVLRCDGWQPEQRRTEPAAPETSPEA
ncbi:MAG TPA: hypothetical protein VMU19_12800 [Bryobacteraceae bacterium]|nr:hypothetical protein [Bryobacteraceae bacterium]